MPTRVIRRGRTAEETLDARLTAGPHSRTMTHAARSARRPLSQLLALITLSAAGRATVGAQAIAPGDRLRVTAPVAGVERVIGTLSERDSTTLWLKVAGDTGVTAIPIAAIRKVERSVVEERLAAPALATGVFFASVLAGALSVASEPDCNSVVKDIGCGIAGAFVGGLIAGAIQEHMWPRTMREGWRTVTVEAQASGQIVTVGATVAF